MKIACFCHKSIFTKPVYIGFFCLFSFLPAFTQQNSTGRKYTTQRQALIKIASAKTNLLAKDITLTAVQKKKIRNYFLQEAILIDSLKYMPAEFYEDPMRSREAIITIKKNTEDKIGRLLTEEQRIALEISRENKRKAALQRLQNKESAKRR